MDKSIRQKSLMTNTVAWIALALIASLVFSGVAHAWGSKSWAKGSPTQPVSIAVKAPKKANFKAKIKYDSTFYGIPLPAEAHIAMEFAENYTKKPVVTACSFASIPKFSRASASNTGARVWRVHKKKFYTGKTELYVNAKVTGVKKKTAVKGFSYLGTGKEDITEFGSTRKLKVK